MKRTKLSDRQLPDYTKGEEIFNMVSHIVGGALGLAALVLCVVFSAIHRNPWAVVGSSIYGASLVTLYTISSVYHGLRPGTGPGSLGHAAPYHPSFHPYRPETGTVGCRFWNISLRPLAPSDEGGSLFVIRPA